MNCKQKHSSVCTDVEDDATSLRSNAVSEIHTPFHYLIVVLHHFFACSVIASESPPIF